MNIAQMQMMTNRNVSPKQNAQQSSQTQNVKNDVGSKSNAISAKDERSTFGSVFGQVIASTNQPKETTSNTAASNESKLEELAQVLGAESIEELLTLLGIPHDDGLLMLQVGDEGKAVAIDEMLNLEDIMAALNIDAEQLLQVVQQLLGEDKQASDIWELLSLTDEQAALLQSQIVSALQGEEKVTPKEANQLLQVLKLAQLLGAKSDLTMTQEATLTNVKNFLTALQEQVQQTTVTKTPIATIPLQGFQVVTQQVVKQADTNADEVVTANTVQTKANTFQVTLPTAKPAQSEALLREMQAIINKAQISQAQGVTRLTLKLYPENLGTIRIELMQNDGVLTARILASTAQGRELLDNQLNQLRQAFAQQNIQVDRLDVTQSLQDADRQNRDQNFFNNFFKQQHNEEETKESDIEDEEELSFSDYLINEEV
ncbi:MAG: flagellar hook-length control protein FliK [Lysinibacillus sp.]